MQHILMVSLQISTLLWFLLCHGMTKSVKLVKVHRKDQSVNKNAILPVSCVSLISLIEIWSFCTKLLENYPFV